MNLQKIVIAMLGLFFAKKGVRSIAKKKALQNPKIQQSIKQITAELEQLNRELEQD
jgi:hypothetical protein|tara:strand:+ start:1216 stop:1383 length:168 start_codon:yes stop_codon:yes gene_type:complete